MSNKPLNIGEEARVQMPMKTVASLIVIVAMGVWGYFGIVEKLNQHSTRLELMEKDLTENTDFRIKWPRGQLGSLPADSEQFMMIEDLYKTTDKLNAHIENMALNKVNIEFQIVIEFQIIVGFQIIVEFQDVQHYYIFCMVWERCKG